MQKQVASLQPENELTPEERARLKEEYNQQKLSAANYKKGKEDGAAEALRKVAQRMLLAGLSAEQIAMITGLTESEMTHLKTDQS